MRFIFFVGIINTTFKGLSLPPPTSYLELPPKECLALTRQYTEQKGHRSVLYTGSTCCLSFKWNSTGRLRVYVQYVALEAAEGRTARYNGWNGANGMTSNTWVWYIWYHSTYCTPAITTRSSLPIKVPPTSCGMSTGCFFFFTTALKVSIATALPWIPRSTALLATLCPAPVWLKPEKTPLPLNSLCLIEMLYKVNRHRCLSIAELTINGHGFLLAPNNNIMSMAHCTGKTGYIRHYFYKSRFC